jgi:hypothetical protein
VGRAARPPQPTRCATGWPAISRKASVTASRRGCRPSHAC